MKISKKTMENLKKFLKFYHTENKPKIISKKDGCIYIRQNNGYVFKVNENGIKFAYLNNERIDE